MMKVHYTSGPLTSGDIEYGTILQGNTVLYRLNCGVKYEDLNDASKNRLHADATLYAAAPELAEMLLSMFVHVSHGGPTREDAERLLRKAGVL